MSGVLTAHSCLGYGSLPDMISGRNLIEDIWHMDKYHAKYNVGPNCEPLEKVEAIAERKKEN